jgi:hypothetical protein
MTMPDGDLLLFSHGYLGDVESQTSFARISGMRRRQCLLIRCRRSVQSENPRRP